MPFIPSVVSNVIKKKKPVGLPPKEVMNIPNAPVQPVSNQINKAPTPSVKPELKTKIVFNKDKSVEYTPAGGQPVNLSQEEYNVLEAAQSQKAPPKTSEGLGIPASQKVQDIQKTEALSRPEKQARTLGIAQVNPEDFKSVEQMKQEAFAATTAQTPENYIKSIKDEALNAFTGATDLIASLLSGGAGVGSKKSKRVAAASGALNDAVSLIHGNIASVKTGDVPLFEAQRNLEFAVQKLNELEITTYGLGAMNINYLVGGGLEIEAEIKNKQAELVQARLDLITAGQEARLIKAAAAFK